MKRKTLFTRLKEQYPDTPTEILYARIMCGEVRVRGEKIQDPQWLCPHNVVIELCAKARFVSRGGEKLEGALHAFGIDCRDKVFLDCGASTGGFSDCLLARGAKRIYAVDVGYSQLDFKLRMDPRVVVLERTNVKSLTPDQFEEIPDAAVIDLSFRSIKNIASHVVGLTKEKWALVLVKPQFEWENPPVDFSGVVVREHDRITIIENLVIGLWKENLFVQNAVRSFPPGRRGNREYFLLLRQRGSTSVTEPFEKIRELFGIHD